ncbi:MAG TPA: DUF308 domain-containing protein [Bacteroidales bacterium]|nr:DUF308 domain-containing protein [Bacteroidales bacterium]
MRTKPYRNWWFMLIKGILICLSGLFVLLFPDFALLPICYIIGAFLFVSGISLIAGSITHRKYNFEWTWWLFEGIIDVIIGLLIALWPGEVVSVAIVILAIWIIIMGLIQLITAINIQHYVSGNLIFIFAGIFSIILGILLLFNPLEGARGFLIILGLFALIYGALQIFISFKLKKIIVEEIGEIEDLY